MSASLPVSAADEPAPRPLIPEILDRTAMRCAELDTIARVKLTGNGIVGVHRHFVDGLESCLTTIRRAAPENRENVIANMARHAASFICEGGFKQSYVVDRINEELRSFGLEPNAQDLIERAAIATASRTTARTLKLNDQDRLKPILWSDLHRLPKREALVEGLLNTSALSVVFGPSGCGKTFFALDLAAHVALDRPWRGRNVLQGAVVYVAAEGGHGIQERLEAFRCFHGIDQDDFPFYVIPEPIDLCHSEKDVDLLLRQLETVIPKDQPIRLIDVDTVSRALAGGNENSPDHMGALVRRCDKLRLETGAHLMLVHHTGKDTSQGARGHSSLRAAVDTEIELSWDKQRETGLAAVTKQRDSRTEGKFTFEFNQVDVGMSANGNPVSSCVVVPTEDEGFPATKQPHLTDAARIALTALAQAIEKEGQTSSALEGAAAGRKTVTVKCWREYAYHAGISNKSERARQQAFKRAMKCLVETGRVGCHDDLVWLKADHQGDEHTNTP